MNNEQIHQALHSILVKGSQVCDAYEEGSKNSENRAFADYMLYKAKMQLNFNRTLRALFPEYDPYKDKVGSTKGFKQSSWLDGYRFRSGNSDVEMFNEVQKCDGAAVAEYDRFLKIDELLPSVKVIVAQHRSWVVKDNNENASFNDIR